MGSPIRLDALLVKPEHSFVAQSFQAQRTPYAVNGDGFGVGWYAGPPTPGLYRDIQPAWNDDNLRSLAGHVRSRLFLAHVRASSGTAIQRTNCHPFRYGKWLFQHNGEISRYEEIKQRLDAEIARELYPAMEGSTDTERIFFLALTYGLEHDPVSALRRAVGSVEQIAAEHGIEAPLRMTATASDGHRLFAVRHSSDGCSPSLYHSRSLHALREIGGRTEELPSDALIVLSEPLDTVSEHWEAIEESCALVAEKGSVTVSRFAPEPP